MLHNRDAFGFVRRRTALGAISAILVASCGGSGSAAEPTTTVEATTSTAVDTTVESTTTTTGPFAETTDLTYMTIDGVQLLMDVYVPSGDGPWPVVVAFHGIDSDGKDGQDTASVGEAAAAEGMVVFAPSWIVWNPPTPPVPVAMDTFQEWERTANCAVAFAQQNATDYGGDPANTVIYGFSAGAGFALAVAVGPSGDPIPGCATEAPPEPLSAAVLGDGEYWMHSDNFDAAFEADPVAMQAELASLIDPTYWPADLDAKFFLWVAKGGTGGRSIGDPLDESGWFAHRDPDGSIQSDLERLDQFEDGAVSSVDAGQLLALRLSEAGIEVILDEYPGGHTVSNKVSEIVGYLKAAAAQ